MEEVGLLGQELKKVGRKKRRQSGKILERGAFFS